MAVELFTPPLSRHFGPLTLHYLTWDVRLPFGWLLIGAMRSWRLPVLRKLR